MSSKSKQKIKTKWDLSKMYKSVDDPQMETDIKKVEKSYSLFVKKYKNKATYTSDENVLHKALLEYERLCDTTLSKPLFYLNLAHDLDSKDSGIQAKINLLSDKLQKIGNSVLFFGINLSKIKPSFQKKVLSNKKLGLYRYFLKKIFENAKYILTEPEEKILSLKSLTSYNMWTAALDKMRSKQTIKYKGKEISISQAGSILTESASQEERIGIHNKLVERYLELGDVAESELNAIVTDKKIDDELRGLKEAYDATILSYENDKDTVLNLAKNVTDSFPLVHRFYAVKQKMLGLSRLTYADRVASVGKTKRKVSFSESYSILSKLFNSIDPKFGNILADFVTSGQIDVYPKIGKTDGAYSAHFNKLPGFVLLNYTDTLYSLQTFAHEMGHSIHSMLASLKQPVFYRGYSMCSAEVASTLFEYFLFYDQFERLSDKEKVIALHDKIQDDVNTVFRQIACFNFEVEMHKTIRERGFMPKEDLAKMMAKHVKSCLGEGVELTEKDGYLFVGWSHIRRFFYVYTYAFGQLASKALYKKYSADKSYIEKIKTFMSLGGSMSPEDIFKSIGVDVKKPDFWKLGIKSIEEDVILLESLVKQPLKASSGRMTKK